MTTLAAQQSQQDKEKSESGPESAKFSTVVADPTSEVVEKLQQARVKLQEHKSKGSDNRIIGQWQSRVRKYELELSTAQEYKPEDKDENQDEVNSMANSDTATKDKPKTSGGRTKTAKTGGTTHCLCGCGSANNPGSRFQMGHDARLKSVLGKVENGVDGFSVPKVAIEAANAGNFKVGDYDSARILKMVNGSKPSKTPAKKSTKKTTAKAK